MSEFNSTDLKIMLLIAIILLSMQDGFRAW